MDLWEFLAKVGVGALFLYDKFPEFQPSSQWITEGLPWVICMQVLLTLQLPIFRAKAEQVIYNLKGYWVLFNTLCILHCASSALPQEITSWYYAAKSLQSCLTLYNPMDGSSPGSPILGILQAKHWSGLPVPSPMHESEKWKGSRSVVFDSSQPHGLQPTRLLCPWDFPGKSAGVGCHCLLCHGTIFIA